MILLLDNYDSFVHNLARYFERLGQATKVMRNDEIDLPQIQKMSPKAIVLSPGPCTPAEAGCSLAVVQEFCGKLPILGICLGHQVIAAALGARIVRAKEPMHGRTSLVKHQQTPLFTEIPSPFTVCRYHSLIVDPTSLSPSLQPTAHTEDGTIMAIQHTKHPVFGVQFHPEAILTEHGYPLLANFLSLAGLTVNEKIGSLHSSEILAVKEKYPSLPEQPVTF